MANKDDLVSQASVGGWAKRCYLAGRALIEDAVRPHGLGATQWYVLYHLVHDGPTMQRDLLRTLRVERATLSVVVGSMVRKGLVEQTPDRIDQRQKRLQLTPAGHALWAVLPELTFIRTAGFEGLDADDLAAAVRVLRTATERLEALSQKDADR